MPHDEATASVLSASAFAAPADRIPSGSAKLLPAKAAFTHHGRELAELRRQAHPAAAITFSPAWWQAVPPPRGYRHRVLLLRRQGQLRAAMYLRERTFWGLPTGILHGGDAKGESLLLCRRGTEPECLAECVRSLFHSRRCIALLLNQSADRDGSTLHELTLEKAGLQQRSGQAPAHWQTMVHGDFSQTLSRFGHRTRRNLRHALRRATQNGWQFVPELDSAEIAEATDSLARHSTHPYLPAVIAARLELERSQVNSFSMGLRDAQGQWLSLLSGARRLDGAVDIFWQSNVAAGHNSVSFTMRALLMQHEGTRGSSVLRWIGGTSPLMEHCCLSEPSRMTLVTRPGLRQALLRRVLDTELVSAENPVKKLLRLEPSGACLF